MRLPSSSAPLQRLFAQALPAPAAPSCGPAAAAARAPPAAFGGALPAPPPRAALHGVAAAAAHSTADTGGAGPARVPADAAMAASAVPASGGEAAFAGGGGSPGWARLGVAPGELVLEHTLPTGQSFRWRATGEGEFTGVVAGRVVCMRQPPGQHEVYYAVLGRAPGCPGPEHDAPLLADYFNLGVSLAALSQRWAAADPRFAAVVPHIPGARMLRQPPLECLLSFVCSSNNHISRIHGMVERLCATYGSPIDAAPPPPPLPEMEAAAAAAPAAMLVDTVGPLGDAAGSCEQSAAGAAAGADGRGGAAGGGAAAAAGVVDDSMAVSGGPGSDTPGIDSSEGGRPSSAHIDVPQDEPQQEQRFYAFPTLEQLAAATVEQLYDLGFGYRAKFIVGSVAMLREPERGEAWLHGLRTASYADATAALQALPGVGPKVAACVCLFALDKHGAVPVDTHVWQLATRYYAPHLRGKNLAPKIMPEVEAAFLAVFGEHAGWAHNTLFVSELASLQHKLPQGLRRQGSKAGAKGSASAKASAASAEPAKAAAAGKGRRSKGRRAAAAAPAVKDDPDQPAPQPVAQPAGGAAHSGAGSGDGPADGSLADGLLMDGPLADAAAAAGGGDGAAGGLGESFRVVKRARSVKSEA